LRPNTDPAAYHHIVFAGEERKALHWQLDADRCDCAAAAGLSGDVFVVIGKIVGSEKLVTRERRYASAPDWALVHLSVDRPRSAAERYRLCGV
jgi:hypothetical protein